MIIIYEETHGGIAYRKRPNQTRQLIKLMIYITCEIPGRILTNAARYNGHNNNKP